MPPNDQADMEAAIRQYQKSHQRDISAQSTCQTYPNYNTELFIKLIVIILVYYNEIKWLIDNSHNLLWFCLFSDAQDIDHQIIDNS